jgi:hypothetical protein
MVDFKDLFNLPENERLISKQIVSFILKTLQLE